MLGADRPVQLAHDTVDDVVELLPTREIGRSVGAFRLGQVEVDVAVPDMAEGHRPNAGQPLGHPSCGAGDKVGHPADRHRDVMLYRARKELRLYDSLSDTPQLLSLRATIGNDAVSDEIFFESCFDQPFQ